MKEALEVEREIKKGTFARHCVINARLKVKHSLVVKNNCSESGGSNYNNHLERCALSIRTI